MPLRLVLFGRFPDPSRHWDVHRINVMQSQKARKPSIGARAFARRASSQRPVHNMQPVRSTRHGPSPTDRRMRHALATTLLLSMPSATLSFHAPEPGKIRGNHDSSAVRSGSPTLVLGASSALARQSELAPGSKPALGTVLQALQRAAAHPDLRHISGATLQAGGLGASADAASQAMHALPVDLHM